VVRWPWVTVRNKDFRYGRSVKNRTPNSVICVSYVVKNQSFSCILSIEQNNMDTDNVTCMFFQACYYILVIYSEIYIISVWKFVELVLHLPNSHRPLLPINKIPRNTETRSPNLIKMNVRNVFPVQSIGNSWVIIVFCAAGQNFSPSVGCINSRLNG